jgi:1-acyl-sn-glycerol-3-phosphate acyltransferase
MGRGLSLYAVYQMARVTVPTFAEGVLGRLTRDAVDRRTAEFSRRVLDKARVDIDLTVSDRIDPTRAYVYMSNHQSHIDIPVLYSTIPARSLRMVAKTELFKVPMWGPAMRKAGFIEVNRANRAQAIASLARAADQIADGISVWIAPEGSRSRTGELGPLKKGGFHLARDTGAEIVPVAISGTRDILPAGGTSMAYDASVQVIYGDPIATRDRSIDELIDHVRGFLEANVAQHG